ncbi:MAG: hypothetical protein JWQ97_4109, partial [Phenylobacterium sp.]|nr:hypothetical protein [Phenylobacterium sp.]
GVYGAHVSTGIGVAGLGLIGVSGGSLNGVGVMGVSAPAGGKGGDGVQGITNSEARNGVYGRNDSTTPRGTSAPAGNGVLGFSQVPDGAGVMGAHNGAGSGVSGVGATGVSGASRDISTGHGVYGTGGFGVTGVGSSIGIWGIAKPSGWAGYFSGPIRVEGGCDFQSVQVAGRLVAINPTDEGVHAETQSTTTAAIGAIQMNATSDMPALFAKHAGHRTAAYFEGDVVVTGDITLTNAADCAEDFDIALSCVAEPGTLMVLDDDGRLRPCDLPYDKRAVGVVSGAGDFKPGLVLDKQADQAHRSPIALLGKVFCKAEAESGPITVGDLLTTSSIPGHAMRAEGGTRAFGSVVGKALRPLAGGRGLIPILIALQ